MEPVTTTIVAAVVAGVVAATKNVAAQAVKDAYAGFKKLLVSKFGDSKNAVPALEGVENAPESETWQAVLRDEIEKAGLGQDEQVVKVARALLDLLEKHGEKPTASYHADLRGSGAIAQGAGAVAAGEGGIAVGRDVQGGIHVGGQDEDKK
jgi:hypothetical protein